LDREIRKDGNQIVADIWNLLEPVITVERMELIEVEYRCESMGWVLRLFIDKEGGVSVEDCATLSRTVGDVLDAADLIQNSYHLEVSSPGLDRPLRKWRHFEQNIGNVVEIRTTSPLQNRRNFKGVLKEASPEQVDIECDGKSHVIPLQSIERARLLYFESMNRETHRQPKKNDGEYPI